MKAKQNTIKGANSSSIHKKGQKPHNSNSKTKTNVKARQHEALKKFNKTIQELKKPNNRASIDHFQPSNTVRSKTPSPLKQIQITEPNTNLQSVFSMYKNPQCNLKQLRCSKQQKNKANDQNFIEDLFNNSLQKSAKKKNDKKKLSTNGNLIEQMLSKIVVKTNQKKDGYTKKLSTECNINPSLQFQMKMRQLEDENQFFVKAISEKDLQIKILNQKLCMYQQHCQMFTLNTFQAVAVFKKLEAQKESLSIDLYSKFLQTRMNKLIVDINFFVEKLKLEGKIRLKGHILQKQLSEAFAGQGRAYTQDSRFPTENNFRFQQAKDGKQFYKQKGNQQHFRSRSSQPPAKKNESLQILIDILSRRDSIPSSRKQCNDEQKATVTKKFPGLIQAHQLILNKGDVVTILKKNQNGWWIGMKQGIVGYFPSDCIKGL